MLTAMKLTKENLSNIATATKVNPESIRHLAANRDQYVLFETESISRDTWRLMPEPIFKANFSFNQPETNQFLPVIYHP